MAKKPSVTLVIKNGYTIDTPLIIELFKRAQLKKINVNDINFDEDVLGITQRSLYHLAFRHDLPTQKPNQWWILFEPTMIKPGMHTVNYCDPWAIGLDQDETKKLIDDLQDADTEGHWLFNHPNRWFYVTDKKPTFFIDDNLYKQPKEYPQASDSISQDIYWKKTFVLWEMALHNADVNKRRAQHGQAIVNSLVPKYIGCTDGDNKETEYKTKYREIITDREYLSLFFSQMRDTRIHDNFDRIELSCESGDTLIYPSARASIKWNNLLSTIQTHLNLRHIDSFCLYISQPHVTLEFKLTTKSSYAFWRNHEMLLAKAFTL